MSVAKLAESIGSYAHALSGQEVITTTANGKEELNVPVNQPVIVEGVSVTYYSRWTKDHTHFSPALLLGLWKKISHYRKSKKKISVHIHSWWNTVAVLSCVIALVRGVPVFLSPRGMLNSHTETHRHSFYKSFIHWVMGKALLKRVHLITSSNLEKKKTAAFVQSKTISVIPNIVALPHSVNKQAPGRDHERLNFLFVGRIDKIKGLDLLFTALSTYPLPWELSIAGTGEDGYVHHLQQLARQLTISGHINWMGHIHNEEKFTVMANHDVLVLTSYTENFANVVIESLAVGTPVILSDQVGLADYVERTQLGWVAALNVRSIGEKLLEAGKAKDMRTIIRKKAPEIINADFNEISLVQQYINVYQLSAV